MVKLSALVCVQNQEDHLSECLRRLWFCDEIVVVADRCSDGSEEIARRHGAFLIAGSFPLESQRRAAGLEAASGEWILEIAPDERVDSALAWEIRATLNMKPAGDSFEVTLANHVGQALVRRGWIAPLGSEREVRLYRPGAKRWADAPRDAGETPGGAGEALTGELRREVPGGVGGLLEAFNRLTALEAEDRADARDPGRLGPALAQGVANVLRSYLGRAGWREGGHGLILAALGGLFPVVAHLKAQEALQAQVRATARPRDRQSATIVKLGVG